jgi:hypothetical protein
MPILGLHLRDVREALLAKSSCFFGAVTAVVLATLSAAAQVPLVNQGLIPVSTAPGSKGFTLTVNGTGFKSTAVVNWNGSPRLTEVISSSQLHATINASDVSTAQTGFVTVTNPPPGGGTSNVVFFPVTTESSTIGMAISQPFPNAVNVVVGDFNNDGKLDVAWTDRSGNLYASLGNGKGGFQTAIQSTGFLIPLEMLTGDFNGDGKLDIVAVDCCGDVRVMLGNGDGTFNVSWTYRASGGGNLIATADFNGDGKLDLYLMEYDLGEQWFEILTGNGDGTFNYPTVLNYTSYFPQSPAIGDFNGDGNLDLAIPESAGSLPIDIFLGNGQSGFQESGMVGADLGSAFALTADMNLDGKLDLLAASGCIWLGAGNATFTEAGCSNGYYAVGIGDFNGDGKLDTLLFDESIPAQVTIDLGAGDGTYLSDFQFTPPTVGGLAVGDFNNDGKLDVITASGYLLLQTTVDLMPFSLAFGSENVGTTSAAQTATLTNVGTTVLAINKISITGANAASFAETSACGMKLAAGASCAISVTFAPKTGGSLVAALSVSYKGTASPQTVGLSGSGLAAPTVSLLPAGLTFATQLVGTSSGSQTATFTNTGDQAVTISGITASGDFSETNNCPSSLMVGGSCTIQVTFVPTAAGAASGTLSVTDDAANSPQKATLSGSGTVITVSPVGVNFGDQEVGTTSGSAAVTLTNSGAGAVSISRISITGADAGEFSETNKCGKSLAAHSSCTIRVTFKPATIGALTASVSVTDNGGASPQNVSLTGTGTGN